MPRFLISAPWVAALLASVAASGCCNSNDYRVTFLVQTADEGRTCEEMCSDAVVSASEDVSVVLTSCEEVTSDSHPRVVCDFERTVCVDELH